MQHMNIGDAAAAASVTPKMIRHYEALGLIPEAERTEAGYRLYGEREISMLRFIRQARGLGFSIEQIESLLSLWRDPGRHSQDVKEVAARQLEQLEERQRELDHMRTTLQGMVERCRGDQQAHCVILDQLASPAASRPAPAADRGRRALKEVRAGEKRAGTQRPPQRQVHAPEAPHRALSAWTQHFVRSSAAA